MSAIVAGATLTAMFVALCLVLIVWANRHHIARAWRRGWARPQDDGLGRDEEEGVPAAWRRQPQPASHQPATTAKRIVISAPQPAQLATLAHNPLPPVVYVVPPPPHLLVSPPTPTPPARALLSSALPPRPLLQQRQQQQSGPMQAAPRPNVPRKPLRQPMLSSPQPALPPIPYHRNHLVPPPLRVGPNRQIDVSPLLESVVPRPVQPTASGHADQKDDAPLTKQPQQPQQQREEDSSQDAVPADNNSGKNKSLSPGSALRDSTGSGSTGSDITLAESPRIMEARAQTVRRFGQPPCQQDPKAERICPPGRNAATSEPNNNVGTARATGTVAAADTSCPGSIGGSSSSSPATKRDEGCRKSNAEA